MHEDINKLQVAWKTMQEFKQFLDHLSLYNGNERKMAFEHFSKRFLEHAKSIVAKYLSTQ